MSVADSFYLNKRDQAKLQDQLGAVPGLIEELSITLTRQSRLQRPSPGGPRRQKPASQIPFHMGASDASDELHNCLSTWVRLVCEQRAIFYREAGDMATLARWLRKNMVALALTEGAEEACDDICYRINECRRMIDLPPEDRTLPCANGCGWILVSEVASTATCQTCNICWRVSELMSRAIEEARQSIGTAAELEKVTTQFIKPAITRKRITYLASIGLISRRPSGDGMDRFQLGEVIDAHAALIARRKAG